jgi:hypothetical protein
MQLLQKLYMVPLPFLTSSTVGFQPITSKPQSRLQVSRKLCECFRLRRIRASDNGRFAGVRVGADLRVQRDVSQESYAELLTLLLDT